MLIMVTPVILIIPYLYHKTGNTTVGIFIHGVFNGPMFNYPLNVKIGETVKRDQFVFTDVLLQNT